MTGRFHRRAGTAVIATLLAVCVSSIALSAPASAEECPQFSAYANCKPGWELSARNFPTSLAPGRKGAVEIEVFNVGAGSSQGVVTVTDTLPPGVTATEAGELVGGLYFGPEHITVGNARWDCTGNGEGEAPKVNGASVVTCTNDHVGEPSILGGAGNTSVNRQGNAKIAIAVQVQGGAVEDPEHPESNRVTVAGGGAPTPASTVDPITISSKPSDFRFSDVDGWFSNADGTLDTQAGSHPYAAVFSFGISTALTKGGGLTSQGNEPRNIEVELPPGFVGDPTAVPQCSRPDLTAGECPSSSEIGNAMVATFSGITVKLAIFNIVPPPGRPAEFGFKYEHQLVFLDASVRTGSDYGITATVDNSPQELVSNVVTTLWGIPGDPTHDRWRGGSEEACTSACSTIKSPVEKPFLTLPTSCGAPPTFTMRTNTWEHPQEAPIEDSFQWHDSSGHPVGLTGCEHLGFAPTIATSPDTAKADTPAGFTFELTPPLGGLEDPEGLGTSDIQGTKVTLPEGLVINPGQAAGLQACQESESGLGTEKAPRCPLASRVGTVTAKTPLLEGSAEKELQGNIYVMQSNPPHLKLLVAPSADGVNIKQVLDVSLDEATGQLTTITANFPQAPVTDVKLSFSGGPQAAIDTPSQCGTYATSADFTPWSSPFVSDFLTSASFSLSEGPGGSVCPSSPLPFSPSLIAGATTDQAGGFTNFSMLLARGDGQQRIEKLQFKTPAGLGGMLSSVPLCGEPQAAQGTCSSASQIGHASVASGPGPYPLVLPQPGAPELPIYLTGPYGGAPFGLSIVTPVLAGPFNLGTIVTRAKIEIDPHTAQITVTTDPLPQVVRGVPTDLRLVDAVIDRPGFMFNPTNCDPQEFSGTAWGIPPPGAGGPGASAPISSHFGVGSCRGLEFHPKFSVSTSGRNSKANGASLTARVSYPNAAQGTQANIGLVKVDLPKQLPSRLTTLQKACTLAQFDANPAGCPPASFIGHATVHTPELPVPLTGPAIFVSHGGEAFPTLTMVLQGDGVTIDLVGSTFIDKAGITSTTFKTVPDAPFSTFELTLPQGPNSALATNVPAKANYSLCGQKLTMPTEFVGQNGAVINQITPVSITGCAKTKTLTRSQKLARALKACHKKPKGHKRVACERAARKRFGAVKGKKKSK
jgi:hypothetical protein